MFDKTFIATQTIVQSFSQCKWIFKRVSFVILMKMIIEIGLCELGVGLEVFVTTTISNVIHLTIVYENGKMQGKKFMV